MFTAGNIWDEARVKRCDPLVVSTPVKTVSGEKFTAVNFFLAALSRPARYPDPHGRTAFAGREGSAGRFDSKAPSAVRQSRRAVLAVDGVTLAFSVVFVTTVDDRFFGLVPFLPRVKRHRLDGLVERVEGLTLLDWSRQGRGTRSRNTPRVLYRCPVSPIGSRRDDL